MLVTRRIVQLTDCHLFADPSRELREFVTWSRFMTVLQDVRQRIPEFDLLVMTGDTAHDEAFETYQSVRGLLGPWIEKLKIIERRFSGDKRRIGRANHIRVAMGELASDRPRFPHH